MITYAFDIEANGLDEVTFDKKNKKQVIIEEATVVHCAHVVCVETGEEWFFDPSNINELPARLNKADLLVAHNGIRFDVPVVSRLLGPVTTKCFDTLVMSKLLYRDNDTHPNLKYVKKYPNSVEAWGLAVGEPKINYTGGFDSYNDDMGKYCQGDVRTLVKIYREQLRRWDRTKLPESYVEFEMQVAKACADMKERGFDYDLEAGVRLEDELSQDIAAATEKLNEIFPPTITETQTPDHWILEVDIQQELFVESSKPLVRYFKTKTEAEKWRKANGYRPAQCELRKGPNKVISNDFNPRSPQEVGRRLSQVYNWRPKQFTKTGQPSVTDDVLQHLPYEGAKLIAEVSRLNKVCDFLKNWNPRVPMTRDGRIHGTIDPQGTGTGRASHKQPNIGNVDSDPRLRRLWIPRTGHVLLGVDQTGIENLMLANELLPYDNGEYLEIQQSGIKIHWLNAIRAGIWPKDEPYDPHNPEMKDAYAKAKTMLYAMMYGAFAPKIAAILDCTIREAEQVLERFRANWTGFNELQRALEWEAAKSGGLRMPGGWLLPVKESRLLLNYKLQGSAAMYAKLWMLYSLKYTKDYDCHLVAWVHDELQWSVRPDHAEKCKELIIQACRDAGPKLGCRVPLDAEGAIGANWSETH